jgi:hypothetical protein
MSFLEKANRKVVHLLFPLVERVYYFIAAVILLFIWALHQSYWPIQSVLMWLWLLIIEIHGEGVAERDRLPIQPGSSFFYRIYRLINDVSFLFLLILLIVLLAPGLMLLKGIVLGVYVVALIPRTVGDAKYRPKKPEE